MKATDVELFKCRARGKELEVPGMDFISFATNWQDQVRPAMKSFVIRFSHEMAAIFNAASMNIAVKNFGEANESFSVQLVGRQVKSFSAIINPADGPKRDLQATLEFLTELLAEQRRLLLARARDIMEDDLWDCAELDTNEEIKLRSSQRHRGYNVDNIDHGKKAQWKTDNFPPGKRRNK